MWSEIVRQPTRPWPTCWPRPEKGLRIKSLRFTPCVARKTKLSIGCKSHLMTATPACSGFCHINRARVRYHGFHLVVLRNDTRGNETHGGYHARRSASLLEQTKVHRIHHRGGGHCGCSPCLPVVSTQPGASTAVQRETY